jgi:hypothetical protein
MSGSEHMHHFTQRSLVTIRKEENSLSFISFEYVHLLSFSRVVFQKRDAKTYGQDISTRRGLVSK